MDIRTLGLAMMLATPAAAEVKLTVGVYNLAGLPGSVLDKAKQEARRIYAKAGVETEWVECDASDAGKFPACVGMGQPDRLALKIMTRSVDGQRSRGALGYAVVPEAGVFGTQAWIFFENVKEVAVRDGADLPDVLAVAMAHELGHLLLGQNAHSGRGVMQGAWRKTQLRSAASGLLRFTGEQAQHMQAQLRARVQNLAGGLTATGFSAASARAK
jgi:hypothetical protein